MEKSLTDEIRSRHSPVNEEKSIQLNHGKIGKKNTMLAITLFFTLFTVATFSGIILWQAHFLKQEEKVNQPGEKNIHPDTIVIAR